ncbi:Hypothetical predicted protein [Mytilus galloprovincialis]|uniref:Dual OB-containing domain-containing protein n=1 Tax=Mytilus galloprovincialis TaxID=29158 RepID=A0A8B6ETN1_MYTGA|nr:Hypothetical predicted protein [Mytilus galloprovincialis]
MAAIDEDTNDLDQYSEDFILNSIPSTPPTSEIVLRIIAKTRMNNGYCYLGFDEGNGRLFRPIISTMAGTCCWPSRRDFYLKKSYRFHVTLNPDDHNVDFLTPYPHCNEDMVVASVVTEEKTAPFTAQVLLSRANLDINEVFSDIKEKRYLNETADSPSAGILKCSSKNISRYFNNHYGKHRYLIRLPSGDYDLPITGINTVEIPKVEKEVVVVLGLGRPYNREGSFNPARFYILVLGLFVV